MRSASSPSRLWRERHIALAALVATEILVLWVLWADEGPPDDVDLRVGSDGKDSGGSAKEKGWDAFGDREEPTLLLDPDAWKPDMPEEDSGSTETAGEE